MSAPNVQLGSRGVRNSASNNGSLCFDSRSRGRLCWSEIVRDFTQYLYSNEKNIEANLL